MVVIGLSPSPSHPPFSTHRPSDRPQGLDPRRNPCLSLLLPGSTDRSSLGLSFFPPLHLRASPVLTTFAEATWRRRPTRGLRCSLYPGGLRSSLARSARAGTTAPSGPPSPVSLLTPRRRGGRRIRPPHEGPEHPGSSHEWAGPGLSARHRGCVATERARRVFILSSASVRVPSLILWMKSMLSFLPGIRLRHHPNRSLRRIREARSARSRCDEKLVRSLQRAVRRRAFRVRVLA